MATSTTTTTRPEVTFFVTDDRPRVYPDVTAEWREWVAESGERDPGASLWTTVQDMRKVLRDDPRLRAVVVWCSEVDAQGALFACQVRVTEGSHKVLGVARIG